MNRPALHPWSAALAIALLLSTSYLLDGPDDIDTAQRVADEVASVQTAQVQP